MQTPHVVVLGCGFGGLAATTALAASDARITVIDAANHHLFQPLLYQVATAGLSAPAIAAPIRHILRRQDNATVLMASVQAIDTAARTVTTDDGQSIGFDYLIVATGATHSYFGHDEWAPFAPGLKTLEDALAIRRRILVGFEHAEREDDPLRRAAWLRFVVIGGGPTGVEMAGTLAEIARHTLAHEFRRIDTRAAKVILVEGSDRILNAFPPDLSAAAHRQLERLGVDVRLNARATGIDATGVAIGDARIDARTVIWAAGVAASPLGRTLGVPLDRAGRVIVQPDLAIPGQPNIFVIGDLAAITSDGKPAPGIAPAAKQMGRLAAANIRARIRGSTTQAFRYRDYGLLATIGRSAAVVQIGKLKLSGWPAWVTWLLAHVYFLIGFRNRLVVLIDWAWAYWTFQRYARIVIGKDRA